MTAPPPVRSCTHFGWPPSVAYVLNWWPLSEPKTYKTFEYRIHWYINVRKNKFLSKKINSSINEKNNDTLSVMLCTGVTFVKKNSCLVARIVSFDTAGLHLLTFCILEPCTSKAIELDFSHVISH